MQGTPSLERALDDRRLIRRRDQELRARLDGRIDLVHVADRARTDERAARCPPAGDGARRVLGVERELDDPEAPAQQRLDGSVDGGRGKAPHDRDGALAPDRLRHFGAA